MFKKNFEIIIGASNDLANATKLAQNMVTKWGLSEKAGFVYYDPHDRSRIVSESYLALIDSEIKEILQVI